jgi:Ca-activated chloride channel family protein
MFRFQNSEFLYALGVVPILVLVFILSIYWRKRRIKKLGDERLLGLQLLGYIPGRNTFKFILVSLGLATIIVGWANLQAGDKMEKVERKGVDVVFALDVSKSMLAKDVQPDRLTRAKQLLMSMMDKMANDRVSLIVFAGKSYLEVPLTVDYNVFKMMLQNVSPDNVPTQGTVIGDAVEMGMGTFMQTDRKYKSMIIISDGEDHDDKAVAKVKEAAEQGVIVHTVGLGSPQGATLFDPETNAMKLDENGQPVVSKLNEEELKSLAAAGGGTYNHLQNPEEVAAKLVKSLESMEQRTVGSLAYTDYISYFQYFLLAGFIILLVEWLLPGAKLKGKIA